LVIVAVIVTGVLLTIFVLSPWVMLLLLAIAWAMTAAVTVWLLFLEIRASLRYKKLKKAKLREQEQPHDQQQTQTQDRSAPETPVPAIPSTPLVRVLETIDLSSTNVEHFLEHDPSQEAENALPVTQTDDTEENEDSGEVVEEKKNGEEKGENREKKI